MRYVGMRSFVHLYISPAPIGDISMKLIAIRLPASRPTDDIDDIEKAIGLTLSSPVVSNGYTSKSSGPYWSNPPF